jgi:DNA-3-methyladenine glycosylase I
MGGELEREYHDRVWGVPVHDDKQLFKMMVLEGMQAGLSWSTILKKMDSLCAAYDDFDPGIIAEYGVEKVEALLRDPGVIRNHLKVRAAIANARAYLRVVEEFGSFSDYLWAFVDGKPIVNTWEEMRQVPVSTPVSDAISKDLTKRGFKFVGPTICYAFMQAVGMVNDHLVDCFRHPEVARLGE